MITSRNGRGALLAALAIVTAAAPATAQVPLPPAAELIAKYQKAIGGKETLANKKFMSMLGDFSMPAASMGGSFEAHSARPNLTTMRVSIDGLGEIRNGFNGEVAWSINPMEGPRVMDGPEKVQAADNAAFESTLRNLSDFKSVETVEKTQLGGKDCFKVKLVWNSGRETFDCFNPDTGLLVGSISTQVSNMGSMEAVTLFDDYKEFEGLTMPTRITVQVMGFEQVVTVKNVKFADLPPATFELPAEIKALIK